jgi:hypothetical protein
MLWGHQSEMTAWSERVHTGVDGCLGHRRERKQGRDVHDRAAL